MVFEADAWDSTISFAPGIPVALGGTLELTFADDVNLAGQVGRTLDLFDWTGVTPTGAFTIASPYMWDTSNLYTTGQVTLTAVPEPSSLAAWLIAGIGWRRWRRPGNRAISRRVRRLVLSIVLAGCSLAGTSKALAAFNVIEATIPEMQAAMESGATTSEGLVNEYLRRIALYDDAGPTLNSVLALNPLALESAQSLDEERLATGPRGPLHGIPILLKDNIDTFDQPTTGGALIFADSVPPDDAFLTQKLRDAGAVVLGKANLTELGNLVSYNMPNGFSVVGGQTLNPYGPGSITPSGSSSGSAVSVAANLVAAAVGTETQGSIVGPAAYNSVVGIRPTVGLISRDGIIPGAHTQDTPGPLARTVTDAAIMLGAMIGVDTNDPKTLESVGHTPANYTQFLNPNGLAGKRLGFVRDPRVFTIDPTEVQLAEAAIDALEQVGATVVDHINFSANVIDVFNLWGPPELPKVFTHEFVPGFESYLASLGENAPANTLAEFVAFNAAHAAQAIPYGQGVLQDALATGGDLNDPGYIAQRDEAIRLIGRDGIDAILDSDDLDALVFPYEWPAIAAVPGYPAIQVPAGFNVNGVPFSVGFVGKPFTEPELIEIAYSFEQATQLRRPPVFLSGDFNHDGSVDAADYVVWRKGLGTTYTQDDYNDWAANFGSTLGSGSSQLAALPLSPAIPEPTSALLLLSFAAIGVWRHRCGFHRPKFTAVKQAVNLRTLGGP
jgi:amidase